MVLGALKKTYSGVVTFFRLHWKGTLLILLATLVFFGRLLLELVHTVKARCHV